MFFMPPPTQEGRVELTDIQWLNVSTSMQKMNRDLTNQLGWMPYLFRRVERDLREVVRQRGEALFTIKNDQIASKNSLVLRE